MEERKYFPLSPDQQTLIAFAGAAPAALLNLALKIEIESEIDEALFQKALELSAQRLPYIRCRLHDLPDGTTVQYISEMEEQVFPEWTDCSDWSDKKIDHRISKWAGTAFPSNLRDVQLFRVELLRENNGKHILYFCGHHIITDIYAVVYFTVYLDKVYYALQTGTKLPREGSSPEEVTLSKMEYFKSEKLQQDREWWQHVYESEPQFTSINGLGGHEYIKGKRYGHDRSMLQMAAAEKAFRIPEHLETMIQEYCAKKNLPQSMIYLFGLRSYLAAACQTDDVSVLLTIASRATLAEKSSGLDRSTGYLFRGNITPDTSFDDSLKEMNRLNLAYMKHADYPDSSGALKDYYNTPQKYLYHSIIFSFVQFVDYSTLHLRFKASEISSGVAICPVYALAMQMGPDEGMKMVYRYSTGYVKEEAIEKCQAFIERFLETGLNDPKQSIGKLMQESFDASAQA